jgi:hypothetical protein
MVKILASTFKIDISFSLVGQVASRVHLSVHNIDSVIDSNPTEFSRTQAHGNEQKFNCAQSS